MRSVTPWQREAMTGPKARGKARARMVQVLAVIATLAWLPVVQAADDPVTVLQKEWADPCPQRIEEFTRQLGELAVGLDRMPDYATEIGWEAVQQMTDLTRDQQKVVCDALDTPAAR